MGSGGMLVERESELVALDTALRRSSSAGAVVVIEGPAGIGKTRLIESLRGRATGFELLPARGGALESDIASGLVRQMFEPRLSRAPTAERAALLSGPAGPAADALGVADRAPGRTPGDLPSSLHGLFWLVANLAEQRPLLLEADDVHWADRASLPHAAHRGPPRAPRRGRETG